MGFVMEDAGIGVGQQHPPAENLAPKHLPAHKLPSLSAEASVTATSRPLLAAGITGLGCYLPERIVTNADLEHLVDTTDEWIFSRTGIRERHLAADDESTTDLAEGAARRALQDAGIGPEAVDLIIVATCTPEYAFPSTASLLQDRLKCTCPAFDLSAACSGFVYAMVMGEQFVATGAARTVLVVGAEILSRIVDWSDRSTCVLFGDGAGAAVLQPAPPGLGIMGFDLGADGSGGDLLKVAGDDVPTLRTFFPKLLPGSGDPATSGDPGTEYVNSDAIGREGAAHPCAVDHSRQVTSPRIIQNGREVYRFAVNVMGESASRALRKCGIHSDQVDLFVPHQANIRIIEAAARRLGLPHDKIFANVEKYGNTSAASIPIALYEAREQGRIRPGDTIVTVGFGGGLTWASCVMKWFSPTHNL